MNIRKAVKRINLLSITMLLMVLAAPTIAHAQDITTGLALHWDFEEGTGTTTTDKTSNAYDLTLVNSNWDAGRINRYSLTNTTKGIALQSPTGDSNNLPFDLGTRDFSICTWLLDNDSDFDNIITRSASNVGGWDIFKSSTSLFLRIHDGTLNAYTIGNVSTASNDGLWHHYCITADRDGNATGYLDGAAIGSADMSGTDGFDINNTNRINIGSNFTGSIDDFRIYYRALTAADVAVLAAGSGPGTIRYNNTHNVMEYHEGTQWIAMGHERYVPNAVAFDGTNDGIEYTGGGYADSKLWTGSFWVRRNAVGVQHTIIDTDGNDIDVQFEADNSLRIKATNTSGSTALLVSGNAIADTDWHHVMFSFDMSDTAKRHIYIDDVSALNTITTYNDEVLDFTNPETEIGATTGGTLRHNGALADVWIDFGTYIDLSVAANRRKFINASGNPVNHGTDGSGPTGTAPEIFLSGDTATWHTNDGSGGGFTENGALSDALSAPSDPDTYWGATKLLMHFDGADTSTVFIDSSSAQQSPISQGGAQITTSQSQFGGASGDVSGDTRYISIADSGSGDFDLTGSWTLEFWYRSTDTSGLQELAGFYAGDPIGQRRDFSIDGNNLRVQNTAFNMGAPLTTNTWYHIAYSYDGSDIRAFLNGTQQGSASTEAINIPNVLDIYIGCGTIAGGVENAFCSKGLIDDLRFTREARYTSNFTAPSQAFSDFYCSNPTQLEGSITYNTTTDQMQFCNGVDWIAMGPPGDGGAGCTNPTGTAGSLTYNSVFSQMQYCEGDTWIAIGKGDSATTTALASGLVAHWPLDDTTGSTITDIVGTNNGTWADNSGNSVAEETGTGVISTAITFDGGNDEINAGSATSIDDIFNGPGTVSMWIKPASLGENNLGRLIHKAPDNNANTEGFTFYLDNTNELEFIHGYGTAKGKWETTNADLAFNTWSHVAITFDATTTTAPIIYVNGAAEALTETDTPSGAYGSDATHDLFFGNNNVTGRTFDGALDDVRLYNRALSAGEITALYNLADCPNIGDVCDDGSVYAGLSPDGNVRMYTTRCDLGQSWSGAACTGTRSTPSYNNGNGGFHNSNPNAQDINDGDGNTLDLTVTDPDADINTAGVQPHQAAVACDGATNHGKSDWYLPAVDELSVLYTNRFTIGNFLTAGDHYWSSTATSSNIQHAYAIGFNDGIQDNWWGKDSSHEVRCVRK